MFTKHHYMAVASVIADLMPAVEITPEQVRDAFADLFAKNNPAFDPKAFEKACDLLTPSPRRVTVNTLPAVQREAIIRKAVEGWKAAGRPPNITQSDDGSEITERGMLAAWRAVDAALTARGQPVANMGEMRDAYERW